MNMSKGFQIRLGTHGVIGIRPISASMMPPAKMLPKSRSASVIGLTSSSRILREQHRERSGSA